jgi:hypothetical protein
LNACHASIPYLPAKAVTATAIPAINGVAIALDEEISLIQKRIATSNTQSLNPNFQTLIPPLHKLVEKRWHIQSAATKTQVRLIHNIPELLKPCSKQGEGTDIQPIATRLVL